MPSSRRDEVEEGELDESGPSSLPRKPTMSPEYAIARLKSSTVDDIVTPTKITLPSKPPASFTTSPKVVSSYQPLHGKGAASNSGKSLVDPIQLPTSSRPSHRAPAGLLYVRGVFDDSSVSPKPRSPARSRHRSRSRSPQPVQGIEGHARRAVGEGNTWENPTPPARNRTPEGNGRGHMNSKGRARETIYPTREEERRAEDLYGPEFYNDYSDHGNGYDGPSGLPYDKEARSRSRPNTNRYGNNDNDRHYSRYSPDPRDRARGNEHSQGRHSPKRYDERRHDRPRAMRYDNRYESGPSRGNRDLPRDSSQQDTYVPGVGNSYGRHERERESGKKWNNSREQGRDNGYGGDANRYRSEKDYDKPSSNRRNSDLGANGPAHESSWAPSEHSRRSPPRARTDRVEGESSRPRSRSRSHSHPPSPRPLSDAVPSESTTKARKTIIRPTKPSHISSNPSDQSKPSPPPGRPPTPPGAPPGPTPPPPPLSPPLPAPDDTQNPYAFTSETKADEMLEDLRNEHTSNTTYGNGNGNGVDPYQASGSNYRPDRNITRSSTPLPTRPEKLRFTIWPEKKEEEKLGRLFVGTTTLEDYDLGTKLGEGTFGVVTKATEKVGGAVVALKKLITHNPRDGVSVTTVREIRILKALEHINVVPIRAMVVHRKYPNDRSARGDVFMVFPYMDHDLCGLLANQAFHITVTVAKTLLRQLLEGLAYIHGQNIIHRDIKTANILVDKRGTVMIADFGLARGWTPKGTMPKHMENEYTNMVVTRWYRAPELLLGATKYGPEIDLWSTGCVFGEMFSRNPIICGESDRDQLYKIATRCGPLNGETFPGWSELPGFPDAKGHPWDQLPQEKPLLEQMTSDFGLSGTAVNLLGGLLRLDPAKRLSADDALDHVWFWSDPMPENPKDGLITVDSSHEFTTRRPEKPAPAPPAYQNRQGRHQGQGNHAAGYGHHPRPMGMQQQVPMGMQNRGPAGMGPGSGPPYQSQNSKPYTQNPYQQQPYPGAPPNPYLPPHQHPHNQQSHHSSQQYPGHHQNGSYPQNGPSHAQNGYQGRNLPPQSQPPMNNGYPNHAPPPILVPQHSAGHQMPTTNLPLPPFGLAPGTSDRGGSGHAAPIRPGPPVAFNLASGPRGLPAMGSQTGYVQGYGGSDSQQQRAGDMKRPPTGPADPTGRGEAKRPRVQAGTGGY